MMFSEYCGESARGIARAYHKHKRTVGKSKPNTAVTAALAQAGATTTNEKSKNPPGGVQIRSQTGTTTVKDSNQSRRDAQTTQGKGQKVNGSESQSVVQPGIFDGV